MLTNVWLDNLLIVFLVAMSFAIASSSANGNDLEPRAFSNAPIGLNFLIAGYGYTAGGLSTDPALPIKDARVETHSSVFAYARSLGVLGKSAKFDVAVPYAWLSGSATALGQFHERQISGLADPRFRSSINLYGAPALSLEDFKNYRQDLIVGASLEVTAPGGQYDPDKLLNLGTNRWSMKPEIGISKSLGPVTLELMGGVRIFTNNDDFFGGHTREQAPIYSVQSHLIYHFPYNIWAAVDGTFFTGGRTTLDGIKNNSELENTRAGVTLALPVNRYNSIKLNYSTGTSTRFGTSFDTAGIFWQYRFGGGL